MKIPIVNEQDEIIKIVDMNDRQKSDICRVSALWITNEKDEVLLARRSLSKKRSPGCWGSAVAGTLEEGETYESNVIKEAGEEIGLYNLKPKLEHKVRSSTTHEYFCQWFSATIDGDYKFKKQDSEVEKIDWFTKDQILNLFKQNPEKFVPNFGRRINYFIKNAD